jgi:hypothetical protein
MYAFRFRRRSSELIVPIYVIFQLRPTELGRLSKHGDTSVIIIPRTTTQRQHNFQVSPTDDILLACVELVHVLTSHDKFPECPTRKMFEGCNVLTGSAWCRILVEPELPDIGAPIESWRAALEHSEVLQGGDEITSISTGIPGVPKLTVKITPGLCEDQICLLVFIDGLLQDLENIRSW